MRTALVLLLMLLSAKGYSQSDSHDTAHSSERLIEDRPFICSFPVYQMPEYPGGDTAMRGFIKRNLKYPAEAKEKNTAGIVYIGFTVDSTGSVTNVKLQKGIGYGCDEEALRVVRMMPQWKPGSHEGKPVNISFTLPVKFKMPAKEAMCDSIHTSVEEMPEYIHDDLRKSIMSSLQFVTDVPRACHKIVISFTVDKNGYVRDVKFERNGRLIQREETAKQIMALPQWKPGKHNGEPACVRITLPMYITIK